MVRSVWMVLLMLVGIGMIATPVLATTTDVFQLNVDFCTSPCLAGGGSGTVTVTNNNTTDVKIEVDLAGGLIFHQTSGLDAFLFNVSGPSTINLTSITSGFTLQEFTSGGPISPAVDHEDGAGTFSYVVCYQDPSDCPQSSGGPHFDGTQLIFEITGGSAINVETLTASSTKTSDVDFAANVSNGSCTGLIGGGSGATGSSGSAPGTVPGGCTSPVPEPTSILLLGTVLAISGKLLKGYLA